MITVVRRLFLVYIDTIAPHTPLPIPNLLKKQKQPLNLNRLSLYRWAASERQVLQFGRSSFFMFHEHFIGFFEDNLDLVARGVNAYLHCKATQRLSGSCQVILNQGQVTKTTPELAPHPPNCHITSMEEL
ncbi:hypothetical protein TNCV_1906891 [Trichonephila clavipes]|nr:hypothetical protein TNCV_1906891 [Trichonephila clavipes]